MMERRTPPRTEQLHRDLRPYRTGDALNHPLLSAQPYVRNYNAIYNREYQSKRRELEHARSVGNWRKVIWLHERPFRAAALEDNAPAMTDEQYWGMVSEVWLDSDGQEPRWAKLWSAKRSCRDRVMLEHEHRLLGQWSGDIAVYRGYHSPQTARGLSWTPDRATALEIADRPGKGLVFVASAVVHHSHIQALFINRGGSHPDPEVVVLSRHRSKVRIRQL